ncbi:MAG: type II toxin-antitoxin system prevent-host-death family antitoxin [bacterium]|nr:type II toxin-antitoxin system prevent-host-death family antitoxin [bacterium]
MTIILPITQAREELTTVVDNVKRKLSEYVITVNGTPAAVVISAAEYESWKETNLILSDQGLTKAIKAGEKDVNKGLLYTLEELRRELKLAF